jgi:hypothetical protein
MQFRLAVIGLIVFGIIGFVIFVAGSVVAGVDMAIYPAWMWLISLVVIIFLTAIIAVLLVRCRIPTTTRTRLKKNASIGTAAAKLLITALY